MNERKPVVDLTGQRTVQEGIDRLRTRLRDAKTVPELRDVMKGMLDLLADTL